jgi:hypothetical protein
MRLIFTTLIVDPTFGHMKSVATVMKRITISNCSYNKICDDTRLICC